MIFDITCWHVVGSDKETVLGRGAGQLEGIGQGSKG